MQEGLTQRDLHDFIPRASFQKIYEEFWNKNKKKKFIKIVMI